METALAIVVGCYFAAAVYLLTGGNLVRVILGLAVLGNAVNMLIFTAGRLVREVPPIVPEGATTLTGVYANPLPQALILTAIVISFAMLAFALVLSYRAYEELGTDQQAAMRLAEPKSEPRLPSGY